MLTQEMEIIEDFLHEIRTNKKMKGWGKQTDTPKQKIYFRNEQGIKSITMYLEQVIDAPLLNLFALLSEIDLFKNWMPGTDSTTFIADISPFRKCAHFKSSMPWPFK